MKHRLIAGVLAAFLLSGCMSTSQRLGYADREWQGMTPAAQKAALANYKQISDQSMTPTAVYAGPELGIWLLEGQAKMPPFDRLYTFQANYFRIKPGQCLTITLRSIDFNRSTQLATCYDGLRLSLDPSRTDLSYSRGSVFFDYNPVWKRGFTYAHIVSAGYVGLSQASISIKAIP
jgi:hypothetical protein